MEIKRELYGDRHIDVINGNFLIAKITFELEMLEEALKFEHDFLEIRR